MAPTPQTERWIWLEPIGFDNTQADFGVADYIARAGFTPDAACLLMASPDIVLQHPGMDREVTLPPDLCSREGHARNQERERQPWTNHQVRRLVETLHARGTRVFLSFFAKRSYPANRFHREWLADHPELLTQHTMREETSDYNLLRRFRDGTPFVDFFSDRLAEAVEEYGFDGWHGADGNGPLCGSGALYVADFGDDIIAQFVERCGVELPPDVLRADGNVKEGRALRAAWIWRHLRHDWIEFWADRWAECWRVILDRLHACGKQGVINNAWACSPWESLYRYGIDYRKLVDAGVDAIVVESAAAGLAMDPRPGAHEPERSYDLTAMLHLMRAYVPDAKLVHLLNTQDIVEQWDAIRHMPALLERETFSLNNVYAVDKTGALRPAADGSLACLADGMRASEWALLNRWWNLATGERPRRVLGATLVWSDAAMHNQVDDFTQYRSWNTHRLFFHLLHAGAPAQAVVRMEHLSGASGPLLVLNPHLFTAEERSQVAAYDRGAVIAIGPDLSLLPGCEAAFADTMSTRPMHCALRGCAAPAGVLIPPSQEPALPDDMAGFIDAHGYWDRLMARGVSEGFLNACAQTIMAASGGIGIQEERNAVTGLFMEMETGALRVALKNKRPWYSRPVVTVPGPIQRAEVRTDFPLMTVEPEGNTFRVRVPGQGITVVDVFLEGKGKRGRGKP